jgi:hypothetical protein
MKSVPRAPSGRLLPMIYVNIRGFKSEAKRRLPSEHALLKLLRAAPDELALPDLAVRFQDWMALLED